VSLVDLSSKPKGFLALGHAPVLPIAALITAKGVEVGLGPPLIAAAAAGSDLESRVSFGVNLDLLSGHPLHAAAATGSDLESRVIFGELLVFLSAMSVGAA
jgi:hypothetical protein